MLFWSYIATVLFHNIQNGTKKSFKPFGLDHIFSLSTPTLITYSFFHLMTKVGEKGIGFRRSEQISSCGTFNYQLQKCYMKMCHHYRFFPSVPLHNACQQILF